MAGWRSAVVAGVGLLVAVPCGLTLLPVVALGGNGPAGTCAGGMGPSGGWAAYGSWTAEQVGNAAVIVNIGVAERVPRKGWIVAVATAMQESSLRNLRHLGESNDHDSLGLFQQRPSQGWGTPEQIMDPRYAATKFYQRLLQVPGWESMTLTRAAQAVQRSAYPNAYAKWQADAENLVSHVTATISLQCEPADVLPVGAWILPLDKGTYSITSGFGQRWGRLHAGADFAARAGTPIHAAAAGIVIAAECTSPFCDRPGGLDVPGCGWTITIDHGHGIATRYCHARSISVHNGQTVGSGQIIGQVGSTGNSTGNHLHFQVHRDIPPATSANAIDPLPYLRDRGLDP